MVLLMELSSYQPTRNQISRSISDILDFPGIYLSDWTFGLWQLMTNHTIQNEGMKRLLFNPTT